MISQREVETGDVGDRVAAILPQIRAGSDRCESERCVPVKNVDLLRDTGLFRLLQPQRYGGLERPPHEFFDAVAAVGGACTSTGWVAGVLGEHQFLVAQFSERAQDDVWGETPESLAVATADPSSGSAIAVDGGYVVNGTWKFASGSGHGRWHIVGATIRTSDNAAVDRALFLVPAHDVTYTDTWYVGGLRGTGSKDAALRDCFVPAYRVLSLRNVIDMKTPGMKLHDSALFRIPVFTIITLGILAPVVGAARAAVNDFISSMRGGTRNGGIVGEQSKTAESVVLQRLVAETSGLLAAVSALIESGSRETWASVTQGEMSVERRVLNRRDYALAVRICVQIVNSLYEASGTRALYVPNTIDRAWRDVNAAAKHHGLNWDSMGTMSGRYLAGLEPKGQY